MTYFSAWRTLHHCSLATLTPELLTDILGFRLSENMLRNLGWRRFQLVAVFFCKTVAGLVGFLLENIFSLLTLNFSLKNFPESVDISSISARWLSEYDKILTPFLDGFPAGSAAVFATLKFSHQAYQLVDSWQPTSPTFPYYSLPRYGEKIFWGVNATIFNLVSDSKISTYHPASELIWPSTNSLIREFDARFFKDMSRSRQHAVDDRRHNEVAGHCLSYLIQGIFPLPSNSFVHVLKLKERPWLTRWRAKTHGRSILRLKIRLPKSFGAGEKPNGSIQRFMCLKVALIYLPPLLHCATDSQELVAFAQRWWGRAYIRHLFPRLAKVAGMAVNEYLHRFGNRCVH